MTVELLSPDEIRGRLADMVAPLREQLALVGAEIEQYETRLAELRAIRTELSRTLRTITGEPALNLNGKARKNGGGKRKAKGSQPSDEMLERVIDWLREREDDYPLGFTGTDLAATQGFPASSQTHVAKVLRALNEQGRVVLDHIGGPGTRGGAGKFYRLTPEPKR
jgi:hypothetical protein